MLLLFRLPPVISVAPAVSAASAASLSSAAALAIANAEQKALEEKVRALEIRLAQIEALIIDTDSAPGPGRGHVRNPMHVRVLREAFLVAKNTYGLKFNQDFSMKDRLMNLAVSIKIIELSADEIKALAGLAQTQTLAPAVMRTAALPAFGRQEHKDNDAKRKRLSRKKSNRSDCFEKAKDVLSVGFETVEECKACIEAAYMSDEERGLNRPGIGRSFRVLVPTWRSDQLNKFFCAIDEQDLVNKGSSCDERIPEVVEEQLSATLRNALPAWALRS
ncbi:hypothetical protein EDC96DRAFT_597409 [Choanephora cucurbitarum]|nr:hypothetical protein EDC96DRAFT_597409 [Choanephora cucurbitarum]